MRALSIGPEDRITELTLSDDHETGFATDVRKIVGCDSIEHLAITDRLSVWVDEEGMSAGRQLNDAASHIARSFDVPVNLRGTAVLTGFDTETACADDLTNRQLASIRRRLREIGVR